MGGVAKVAGRGRKPKPTARKELAGNPGKRALNKAEPDFAAVTNIDPPTWLRGAAVDMWRRVAPELCGQKVMRVTDLHNLELFCAAYGRWREAEEDLARNGLVVAGAQGGPMKNPAATIVNESARQMATFGGMLGLDPASRSRVIGGKPPGADNPFAALFEI